MKNLSPDFMRTPFEILWQHRGQPGFVLCHLTQDQEADEIRSTTWWADGVQDPRFGDFIQCLSEPEKVAEEIALTLQHLNTAEESLILITHASPTGDRIHYDGYTYRHHVIKERLKSLNSPLIKPQPPRPQKRSRPRGFGQIARSGVK